MLKYMNTMMIIMVIELMLLVKWTLIESLPLPNTHIYSVDKFLRFIFGCVLFKESKSRIITFKGKILLKKKERKKQENVFMRLV